MAVFQPHRYSRTLHCKDGFVSSFRDCDVAFITDIYPAGEKPIEGVSAENLVMAMKKLALEKQVIEHSGSMEETEQKVLKEFKNLWSFSCRMTGFLIGGGLFLFFDRLFYESGGFFDCFGRCFGSSWPHGALLAGRRNRKTGKRIFPTRRKYFIKA